MRKLVLLVCVVALPLLSGSVAVGGIIPSWDEPSGRFGFYPISNEISFYRNFDDAGEDRGETLQLVLINSFKLWTTFNFEFTADYNRRYSYVDPLDISAGKNANDHYVELSIVKPVTSFFSLNVQRVISTFEDESINQIGIRLSF